MVCADRAVQDAVLTPILNCCKTHGAWGDGGEGEGAQISPHTPRKTTIKGAPSL